ncbi:hypothetical protein ACLOAV_002231 [Pseudogymnoascus australis]
MKLSYALSILLPIAALANPIPEPEAEAVQADVPKGGFTKFGKIALRDRAAEDVGLVTRALVNCAIVNVATTVGCRWYPWHTGWNGKGTSTEITEFGPGTKHDFDCYQIGECIGGNCTWDWATNWGCYVPGYYTDSKCTKAKLGRCPFT